MEKLHIKTNQRILHSFVLPFDGTVLVRTGQEVQEGDPIAEIRMPDHYQVFDIINNFKIDAKHLDRYVERLVGEPVQSGDVIARKRGVFSRIFRASADGMVVSLRDGKVTLALGERKEFVRATLPGLVVELIPDRGAVIAIQGSLLQGAWGNGKNASGLLFLDDPHPEDPQAQPDESNLEGRILAGGSCLCLEDYKKFLQLKPAGLVFASIAPELLPIMEKAPLPVMSLIGFGDHEIDLLSREMLQKIVDKKVYLLADHPDTFDVVKPELVLPGEIDVSYGLFEEESALKIGARVRLLGKPYAGSIGKVIELPDEVEMFASGLIMRPVVVQREDEQIIRIPRENLEVVIE